MNRHRLEEDHFYQNEHNLYNKHYQPPLLTDEENVTPSSSDEHNIRFPNSNQIHDNYGQMKESVFDRPEFEAPYSGKNYYHNNNHEEYELPPNQELLTITVEIGNGEKENIVIMENDTPEAVAERF